MNYRKIRKGLQGFLWCMFFPILLIIGGCFLPPQYEETFLGELREKQERLEDTKGKRLIFLGGSSVAFGVDSALIRQEFPAYEVINFGMYAALGTQIMLELSEDFLREGDIVVVMPEQQEQTLSEYFNGTYFWQAADGAFFLLRYCPREIWGELAAAFPYFAAEKWRLFCTGTQLQPEGVYAKASFNEWGDIEAREVSQNIMPEGYDPNMPILFERQMLTEGFADALNVYAKKAEERGAVVWYHFCPMNASAIEADADIAGYYDSLQERLCFPIAGNPYDSVLDAGWFYDTNFHLNNAGKQMYTRQLVKDIKAMLQDSSPTRIEMVQMPELLAATEEDKNQMEDEEEFMVQEAESGYFLWEKQEGEIWLTGLTDEGKRQKELTIPDRIASLPVTRIMGGAFAESEETEKILIGENIVWMGDDAFAGCQALKEVVLPWTDPAKCLVGSGLLNDTKAKIMVPKEAVSAYKVHYTWSVYAHRIQGKIRLR